MAKLTLIEVTHNSLDVSTELITHIARRVSPRGLGRVVIEARPHATRAFAGFAWGFAPVKRVAIRLGDTTHFPFVPCMPGSDYGRLRSRREALVVILAHELYHIHQARTVRAYDEPTAHAYAKHQLRRYRRWRARNGTYRRNLAAR